MCNFILQNSMFIIKLKWYIFNNIIFRNCFISFKSCLSINCYTFSVLNFIKKLFKLIILSIPDCYIFFNLFQFFNFVFKFLNIILLDLFIHDFLSFFKFFTLLPILKNTNIKISMVILIMSYSSVKLYQQPLFHR